jgi:hypothetical protein
MADYPIGDLIAERVRAMGVRLFHKHLKLDGVYGPKVTAKSKLDPAAFFRMMKNVHEKHPQAKIIATTLREVHSTNRRSWGAVAGRNTPNGYGPTKIR